MNTTQRRSTLSHRLWVGARVLAIVFGVCACSKLAEADEISLTPSQSAQELADKSKQAINEQWLIGMVEGAYLFNSNLNNFTIDVDADGNSILLTGAVSDASERELAEQIALSINGVDRVDNQLQIHEETEKVDEREAITKEERSLKRSISDAAITTKVKASLLANSEAHGLAINVDTMDGNVTLRGEVETATEKDVAYYLAKNIDGVNQVDNQIVIAKQEKISRADGF